jgi:hypothetical protein
MSSFRIEGKKRERKREGEEERNHLFVPISLLHATNPSKTAKKKKENV